MTTAAILAFDVSPTNVGGAALVALAVIALARTLLLDRSAFIQQKIEIDALNKRVDKLEAQYDEQRSLKHQALNDIARLRLVLDIVRRLQVECTCNALEPIAAILDNLAAHGEI